MGLIGKAVRAFRDRLAYAKGRTGPDHLRLGSLGEDLAVNAMQEAGYTILERNAHVGGREIDVIAREKGTLVFVEVKTRTTLDFGDPLEAIDKKRIERLRTAGRIYLQSKPGKKESLRFDAVAVDFSGGGKRPTIDIVRNAF